MRVLELCPEIWIALEQLGVEQQGWVFPSVKTTSKQGHISHNWPTDMHDKTIEASDITFDDEHKGKLVLYCWRHTFATDCITNGMDIVHLKDVLGHSRIEQTMRYIHINEDSILRQMRHAQQRIRENIQRRIMRVA
jgi:integrase